MSERTYFCFCEDNCKFETLNREQILAAITQAVESGEIHDVDTGFVTKIKEQNSGVELTFWVGTQAQYNAIEEKERNCFYIITDDTAFEDMQTAITNLSQQYSNMFAIDVSNEVFLDITDPSVMISDVKFKYLPNSGLVFFRFSFTVPYNTTSGTTIPIRQTGSYLPSSSLNMAQAANFQMQNYQSECFAHYDIGTDYALLKVIPTENIDADTMIAVHGWYFCEGNY